MCRSIDYLIDQLTDRLTKLGPGTCPQNNVLTYSCMQILPSEALYTDQMDIFSIFSYRFEMLGNVEDVKFWNTWHFHHSINKSKLSDELDHYNYYCQLLEFILSWFANKNRFTKRTIHEKIMCKYMPNWVIVMVAMPLNEGRILAFGVVYYPLARQDNDFETKYALVSNYSSEWKINSEWNMKNWRR